MFSEVFIKVVSKRNEKIGQVWILEHGSLFTRRYLYYRTDVKIV